MNNLSLAKELLLVFDNLTVSYPNGNNIPILKEFSLELELGKFLAVIGPSGCGKSTLLHATAGFIKADYGDIRLRGQLISEPSLNVGFVSQRYALFPWLTVQGNIAFGLQSKSLPDDEISQIVNNLLEVVGLTAQRNYYPEQLSGGMQQRVALARAIAPEPPLLLLDEPFSALDTETRQRMRELLLRLWNEHQMTILFVTHDIEEALLLADKILLLEPKGGAGSIMDVPFLRPRKYTMVHSKPFQNMVERISHYYGSHTVFSN